MFTSRTEVAEFAVHNEIIDWFKKIINETCEPELHVHYKTNENHFSTYTYVEIEGSETIIKTAMDFLTHLSEVVQYKMPWLNDKTYYVLFEEDEEEVITQLESIKRTNCDITYTCSSNTMMEWCMFCFTFRPDLNDTKMKQIDDVFRSVGDERPQIITFPKKKIAHSRSKVYMRTNILTAFHGSYLPHLSIEDIVSLELANNGQELGCDTVLDHDIQKYLRDHYPSLYADEEIFLNLELFKISEVLLYFIHKYHDRIKQIVLPNILSSEKIRVLSNLYSITFLPQNIVHIDFKSVIDKTLETVDFCAFFHFDPLCYHNFVNYEPNHASQNYSAIFNPDDTLDRLQCGNTFSNITIESKNNSSFEKTNSVLKCVTEHFRLTKMKNLAVLTLREFDLNRAPTQIIRSLVQMMRYGWLTFFKMNFQSNTFIAILRESDENRLKFVKCFISIGDLEAISNRIIENLYLQDMDIELSLFGSFKNIKLLEISNCQILRLDWRAAIYRNVSDIVKFSDVKLDIQTILGIFYAMQNVHEFNFSSCQLVPCDTGARQYITLRPRVRFNSTVFDVQTLFQIFENCEIQNKIIFENCHFRFDSYQSKHIQLNPINVEFTKTKIDSIAFITILENLNKKSSVSILNSCLNPIAKNDVFTDKIIQLKIINLDTCSLDTQTLVKLLSKTFRRTKIILERCDLQQSSVDKALIAFGDLFKSELESENYSTFNQQMSINIDFLDMKIKPELSWLFLRTDAKITFYNCHLEFMMTTHFSFITINSHVVYRYMTFDPSRHLQWLENFTSTSIIEFHNCHFQFTNVGIRNIVIEPHSILFIKTSFDLQVLISVMEMISERTEVLLDKCIIRSISQINSIRPIKIPSIVFKNMQLKFNTVLCILDNFTNLSELQFVNCKIMCFGSYEISSLKLKQANVLFKDMNVDIQILQTITQNCSEAIRTVRIVDCNITSAPILSNVTMEFERLILIDVNYSSELLQIFQYLNAPCIVEYYGALSNQAIMEICTKTPVHGDRLKLFTSMCTKSIYFELFAEYFRPIALNFASNLETLYDLPTNLIPCISPIPNCKRYDWNNFKIKLYPTNDSSVKLEFLRNDKPIDLFYELNDLPDDSDECIVEYY